MARVRGRLVMNAVDYVVRRFGQAAHEQVVAALPREHWGPFVGPLHETSWEPAADVVAYLEAARRLLAPGEAEFFRDAGRSAGRIERESQGYQPMVKDPATAMRLGPKIWSSFYDSGRMEVEVVGPREGRARIFDFAVSPVLCERTSGAWEGLLSNAELRADVSEVRCVHRGDGHCELHVVWTPA
jgi:hypothetical protein